MKINIGNIKIKNKINIGNIKLSVKKVYPELEDLELTPTTEEQIFKSEKYGYNEVKVNAVESEELSIVPSMEEQIKEGLFSKVTVAGDENLIADNIKEGTSIFGVEGNAKTTSVKITDAQYLFYQGARTDYLNEILALCDNVTSMRSMFADCELTELDLSNLDTSNVTNMRQMFEDCSKLIELNVKNFNTAKVTNMSYMFAYCYALKKLDLSNFDTSNVTDMTSMFYACNTLRLLDIRNFTFDKVTSYSSIFHNIPANCEIIVKGDTEKEWVLARRSDFTNVKTVAELGE